MPILWRYINQIGSEIFFAYNSFKWGNNAKYNAGVTCTIIGLRSNSKLPKYLYSGEVKASVKNINSYLVDSANVIVDKKTSSISNFPEMNFGSMPNDGGNLILSPTEHDSLIAENPAAIQIIKRLTGSQEFIRGEDRFCLWITTDLLDFAMSIPSIKTRIERCYELRVNSKRESTKKLASTPYAFGECRYQPTDSIIIPRVSSERREYIPIGLLDSDTVISDSAFAIYDVQVWLFGILTSKMHLAWVKAVGGKLEERIRYSATICYNTFPFPKIKKDQQEELERYAEEVLLTREDFPELTLAQLYDPDKMPQSLRDAHRALDLAVERCYRPEPFTSDEERLEHLFRLYEKMTKKII